MRFPATAPVSFLIFELRFPICDGTGRAPACAAESPKLSLPGAAQGDLPIYRGVVADKQCTCFASKPMWERYPPTPPAFAQSAARARLPRRSMAKAGDNPPSIEAMLRASARQANFNRGKNEIQASLISSASVGATPTPATNFKEVIRLPDCKLLAQGHQCHKTKSEATNWSVTRWPSAG